MKNFAHGLTRIGNTMKNRMASVSKVWMDMVAAVLCALLGFVVGWAAACMVVIERSGL